jgi:hypothetical protein
MQLDRAAVGADRDEQGALQPLGAIFKWRAQTKRLDISRPTSILTREFVSLTIPLVISSDATCPTPAEAFAQHGAMCICKGQSHSLQSLRISKQAVPRPLLNRRQPGRRKVHHRMPRSKAAKGAHGSVVGARDRDVVEPESARADESDGAAKLQKAHPRNRKSALGVRAAASDDCMLHAA